MDRIENLIRGLDPVRAERESSDSPTEIIPFPTDAGHHEPGSTMNTEPIDSGYSADRETENDGNDAFSDDRPVVVPMRRRRRTAMILAGAAAAAVVAGAVVVGGSLGAQSPLPAVSTDPTPSAEPSPEATADPSPSPEPSAEPTEEPSAEPSAVPTGPPADEGCRVQDVDRVMEQGSDFMSLTPWATNPASYTVIGCTDEWMSMDLSDEGYAAEGKDGGNAWFHIAKRVDGQWLLDLSTYGAILRWESALDDPAGRTPQEVMDQWFVDAGIPVDLRPVLVGDGPEDSDGVRVGLQEIVQEDMALRFQVPDAWSLTGPAVSPVREVTLTDGAGVPVMTVTRTFEGGLGGTCSSEPLAIREISSTPVLLNLPSGEQLDTKFVYRVFEDGGAVYGSAALVLATEPASGDYCMLYNVISMPELGTFSMASALMIGPDSVDALDRFANIEEAQTYVSTAKFGLLIRAAQSLEITG